MGTTRCTKRKHESPPLQNMLSARGPLNNKCTVANIGKNGAGAPLARTGRSRAISGHPAVCLPRAYKA